MSSSQVDLPNKIAWHRSDPERRLGARGKGPLAVGFFLSGILASFFTISLYSCLYFMPPNYIRELFLDRGPTQHAAVFFAAWTSIVLIMKRWKLSIQRSALAYTLTSDIPGFVLSSQTADEIHRRIFSIAEDPERFILFNRILVAISNLKNLGRVSDVDDILRSLGEKDESAHETSFALVSGFLWAIPVLGFIGTVLGLSLSIGSFGTLLEGQDNVSGIVSSLKTITGGLSTAFDTTLLALVLALILQLWMTLQKQQEEEFLDDCSEYCLKEIVSRIKILVFEQQREI